jgi:hypothetical protein
VNILGGVGESRTSGKGWSSSLRVGRGANKLSGVKNKLVTKCHKGLQIWAYLDKRPRLRKMEDMRLGMWNVGSLYRIDSS